MFSKIRLLWLWFYTSLCYSRGGDWRNIPIKECGEPLVEIPTEMCVPYYSEVMRLTEDRSLWLRKGAFDQLNIAKEILKRQGYDLMVYDGWRPVSLQENLFWYYMREFTAERFGKKDVFAELKTSEEIRSYFNGLPEDMQTTLREANRTYVSWPSSDPLKPSPHATGGSVDVWLHRDGRPVNLGVPFDWMEENAGAFYHLRINREKFPADMRVCQARNDLLMAMSLAGFSCYPPEIWHFNYGNQMDALVSGGIARYSYTTR